MLLTEFFSSPEGDSHANRKAKTPATESKKATKNDPCWKGYEMVGKKTKGGKEVPNCVPVKETKQFNPTDAVTVDIPLLVRLLEYAREDAKTDMDLHKVAENLIELSQSGRTLSMSDYTNAVKK